MIKYYLRCLALLWLIMLPLSAERGIVVACNDKYMESFLPALSYLKRELHCTLPVEVWYAGSELSEENQAILAELGPITFHDIVKVFGANASDYWGYQIKGLMLKASSFDEVIIADADVYFAQNPEKLFDLPHYQKTGAYFFRDFPIKQFSPLRERREFLRRCISAPTSYLPQDMRFFWEESDYPSNNKHLIHYQESGVVVIDKTRHPKGVEAIFELNRSHQVTYHFVCGDKETYWIGMEMAGEPYAFNSTFPMKIKGDWIIYGVKRKKIRLAHLIDDRLFWFQKEPIPLGKQPIFQSYKKERIFPLSKEDIWHIDRIAFYVEMCRSNREKKV